MVTYGQGRWPISLLIHPHAPWTVLKHEDIVLACSYCSLIVNRFLNISPLSSSERAAPKPSPRSSVLVSTIFQAIHKRPNVISKLNRHQISNNESTLIPQGLGRVGYCSARLQQIKIVLASSEVARIYAQ